MTTRRNPFPAFLVACLLLAAAGAVGCGGSGSRSDPEPESPARGGTAVLGSISDVDAWNEYLSREAFAVTVLRRIYPRLARETGVEDGRLRFEPVLAESWERSDDGLSITFRLREATWSDGRPVLASDVRFTWKAQTSPEVAWTGLSIKEHVVDVEVVDEGTVTFRFDQVYPYQLSDAIEGGILPEHVFGAVPFAEWRTHDWSGASVGAGPFVLESHRRGEEIVLSRNPRYFRKERPRVNRVVVRVVPDAANLLMQLRAGSIHYMENVPAAEAEQIRSAGLELIPFDYPTFDYIGWNGAREPFDDPDVRRALTLAIDREAIVEESLYGFGKVCAGPVPSSRPDADTDLRPWPYDPAEARQLLAGAGYASGGPDGLLQRDGRPFEFTVLTNAGNRTRETVLVKIQEQLRRIGVGARIQAMEMRALRHRVGSGEYDAYAGSWHITGKPPLEELFGSESVPPGGFNVVAYRSPQVDRLIGELDRAPDWPALLPLLKGIQRQVHEDQPYTFLYEGQRLAGVGPRLRDVAIRFPTDPLEFLEDAWIEP